MGFLGASAIAGLIGKSKNAVKSDTSKPLHVHSAESKKQNTGAAPAPAEKPQTYEPRSDGSGQQQPVFMGKKQTEKFSNLTDPQSVDRGGRTISKPEGVDPVGIKPAMNPPMAVPITPDRNIDQEGVNSLYSPMQVGKLKKSGQYSNDSKYGIKATTRPKSKLKK